MREGGIMTSIPDTDKFNAFCIGAVNSGSGKTTISLAIMRALVRRGIKVRPFKCGPDYIDPTYHTRATGTKSINLDTWMMGDSGVLESWGKNCQDHKAAVMEGVMGLFDGRKPGSLEGSTADCARTLKIPIVLVVDVHGMAGSIAPLVSGFSNFNSDVKLCGIIGNRVGSNRHTDILAASLNDAGLPPLLGAFPLDSRWSLPERHLGLVPFQENDKKDEWFDVLADGAEKFLSIDKLLEVTSAEMPEYQPEQAKCSLGKISVAYDRAFSFYYHDNLDLLQLMGYELEFFSPLMDHRIPNDTHILLLGGGFPEMFGQELERNHAMRSSIGSFAESGGKIIAECGGYMYLCNTLVDASGKEYEFCGVIDGTAVMGSNRRSLGYREVTALYDTPFALQGTKMRGHEFHWSDIQLNHEYPSLFRSVDSSGNEKKVGVCSGNVFASYIHIHLFSNPALTGSGIST